MENAIILMAMAITIQVGISILNTFNKCLLTYHTISLNFVEIVEVTIRGPVEKSTGMVMNITDLKEYMDQAVMQPLDHKNLDLDVEFFKNLVRKCERIRKSAKFNFFVYFF